MLQHTATRCNALQHTATHCNALQHTATHCNTHLLVRVEGALIAHVTLLQLSSSVALSIEGKQTRKRVRLVRGRHMLLHQVKESSNVVK